MALCTNDFPKADFRMDVFPKILSRNYHNAGQDFSGKRFCSSIFDQQVLIRKNIYRKLEIDTGSFPVNIGR
jgi:hypothetical protein